MKRPKFPRRSARAWRRAVPPKKPRDAGGAGITIQHDRHRRWLDSGVPRFGPENRSGDITEAVGRDRVQTAVEYRTQDLILCRCCSPDCRQVLDEVVLRVRICAGRGRRRPALPRSPLQAACPTPPQDALPERSHTAPVRRIAIRRLSCPPKDVCRYVYNRGIALACDRPRMSSFNSYQLPSVPMHFIQTRCKRIAVVKDRRPVSPCSNNLRTIHSFVSQLRWDGGVVRILLSVYRRSHADQKRQYC